MPIKHSVIVSSEMTTFVGPGACDRLLLPPDALLIGFGEVGEPVVRTLAFREHLWDLGLGLVAVLRLLGGLQSHYRNRGKRPLFRDCPSG